MSEEGTPQPPHRAPLLEGTVACLVEGGWGLIRHPEEGVVFLSGVLPREVVRFHIHDRARGVAWGRLDQVIESSPDRAIHPCPLAGRCGGCTLHALDPRAHQETKTSILMDTARRIAGSSPELASYTEGPHLGYRIRAKVKPDAQGKIGFVEKSSHHVIPTSECLLFVPGINRHLSAWNSLTSPPHILQQDLLSNPQTQDLCYAALTVQPREPLPRIPGALFSWPGHTEPSVSELTLPGGERYLISPHAFLQNNHFLWGSLLSKVEEGLGEGRIAADLCCGIGFFIPLLQRRYREVWGFDAARFSTDLARRAFPRATITTLPMERTTLPAGLSAAVVDPPRSGLAAPLCQELMDHPLAHLVYVSCGPASFFRDMNKLQSAGYQLKALHALDLFPWTAHLELVGHFIHPGGR